MKGYISLRSTIFYHALYPLIYEPNQAVALSLQRAWRGKQGRERAAALREVKLRMVGAAMTLQNT